MSITTFIPYEPTTGQWVAIQKLGEKDTIYFIDEASMISDEYEHSQGLLFDGGRFLDHFDR